MGFNREEAKRLLAEAGFPKGFNTPLFHHPGYTVPWPSRFELAVDELSKVGINLLFSGLVVMRFLQSDQESQSLALEGEHMTTVDFITAVFCRVDEQMKAVPKHSQATLWPSEVVTLGLLHALKGVGNRAFYRWLARDYRPLFPRLPERTRLFRLFTTHQAWTASFLAAPTLLGVIDTYGIELIHPMREGRSFLQIGEGLSITGGLWAVSCACC